MPKIKRIHVQLSEEDDQLVIYLLVKVQRRLNKNVSVAEIFRMGLRALEAAEADLAAD
jgi:hypothetical protein